MIGCIYQCNPSLSRGLSLKNLLAYVACFLLAQSHVLTAAAESSKIEASLQLIEGIESDIKLGYLKEAEAKIYKLPGTISGKENWKVSFYRYLISETREDFSTSKIHLLKAFKLYPDNPQILLGIASMNGREGNFKLALHYLNKAIYLKPDYSNAYSNRGVVKGALGDTKGAIFDFTRSIEFDRYNALAYQNRGISFELLGDLKKACTDWRTASLLGLDQPKQWSSKQCKKKPPP